MNRPSSQLVLCDLCKSYPVATGEIDILRDVSATVDPGETVAITGPSGSGKSTLLNLIGALDRPTSGSIALGDVRVDRLANDALAAYRASRVGFVFQDHHLLPQLTALENVMLPALATKPTSPSDARARALLQRVGLADRADFFPARLSGGERQRVAIARALTNGAGVLLADEPTGNLDEATATAIVDLFLELAANDGVTVFMVTHDLELAARMGTGYELRDGALHRARSS